MDDEGLDPDALAAELAGRSDAPSFLYTIPTFQNPSGRTLSAERRARLVEIVREHALAVLEDDPYGLVRFEGDAPPKPARARGRLLVTYTSSFSKTVAPGVRTGYFVLPEADVAAFEERAVSTYISPPFLPEAIVWEYVRRGRFEPNLEHVRGELRARRDAMLGALERHFGGGAGWSTPEGGYFVWLDPRRHGHDRARGTRRGGGRRDRPRRRLLPARVGPRRELARLRVQLRDAGADRRGDRAARVPTLTCGRSRSWSKR